MIKVKTSEVELFLRVYYAILLVVVLHSAVPVLTSATFHMFLDALPVFWMGYLPEAWRLPLIFLVLSIFTLVTSAAVLRPDIRRFRVASSVLCFIVFTFNYVSAKSGHNQYAFGLCSLFLIPVKHDETNPTWFLVCMRTFLSFFFIAGAVKAIQLVGAINDNYRFMDAADIFLRAQISRSALEAQFEIPVKEWLMNSLFVNRSSFFLLFAFELGALIPILYTRAARFWGFLIILFHTMTYLLMGIRFVESGLFAAVVLICCPLLFVKSEPQLKLQE